jgi:hypothetical protein
MTKLLHDYILTGAVFNNDLNRIIQQVRPYSTLSIRAVASLGQDFEADEHITRSVRPLYEVSFPDGSAKHYRRMVRLINAIQKHAPHFIPDLYYIVLNEYMNDIAGTRYTASLHILDYAHTPAYIPDPELELFHATSFADSISELCYRDLFYECHLLQGEHYTLITTPLRQQLDKIFLQQHYKKRTGVLIETETDTEPIVDYLLLRRYMVPPHRPVWSRRHYYTLLHDWAKMIDELVDTLRQK